MKLPSRRIITGDNPTRKSWNQEMFATKAQRHEKFLLCYSFLVSWCLSGEKKFCHKKHQNKYEVTAK